MAVRRRHRQASELPDLVSKVRHIAHVDGISRSPFDRHRHVLAANCVLDHGSCLGDTEAIARKLLALPVDVDEMTRGCPFRKYGAGSRDSREKLFNAAANLFNRLQVRA